MFLLVRESREPMAMLIRKKAIRRCQSLMAFPEKGHMEILMMQTLRRYFTGLHEKGWLTKF